VTGQSNQINILSLYDIDKTLHNRSVANGLFDLDALFTEFTTPTGQIGLRLIHLIAVTIRVKLRINRFSGYQDRFWLNHSHEDDFGSTIPSQSLNVRYYDLGAFGAVKWY